MAATTIKDVRDWMPGVLCKEQLEKLVGLVILGDLPADFDKSSMDLTLSRDGWELKNGALKPSRGPYLQQKHTYSGFFEDLVADESGQFILYPGKTYLFKTQQRLHAKSIKELGIFGQATARSSIGRLDVLARLIVDGMNCYEGFRPDEVESGDMFVEITPLSFPISVKPGSAVSQLRLFLGPPEDCEIKGALLHQATILGEPADGYLRVDLSHVQKGDREACALKARNADSLSPVPAIKGASKPHPSEYWERIEASLNIHNERYLKIEKGSFYILRSKEQLALHGSTAVYCMAIDETIGEMRIHYAGFVHPWFGRERKDKGKGTPLIFEVRGHDVPVILRDGEILAKLRYYHMSREPQKTEDQYSDQTLNLSGFFADW
ncbi:MAG: 2'-deoxycytidine 5'-triphosphate deaminase [Verrucomicrobiaceae bacterium]|nr:2'-deoxycytidine 5'-triphosphate deaminase [Verrucomicrobiaceae bacterium]